MKIKRDKVMEQYRRNFYKVYHSHILPILTEHEKERIFRLSLIIIISLLTLYFSVSIFMYGIHMEEIDRYNDYSGFFVIAIIIFILGCIFVYVIRNQFIKNLKKSCMGKITKVFGELQWEYEKRLVSNDDLNKSNLFDEFTDVDSNDCFNGQYKNVNFEIYEIKMKRVDGRRSSILDPTVFKGVVILFDFHKKIKANTYIKTKWSYNIFNPMNIFILFFLILGIISSNYYLVKYFWISLLNILAVLLLVLVFLWLDFRAKAHWPKEIHLEDPEFSKHYKAYSDDQVEGRYLITPVFIEHFKNIQKAFKVKKVKCAFYGTKIMFALSTNKNFFEIGGLFRSLKDPKQMEEFFNELTSIMRLIDRFKLTEHTGL